MIGQTQPGVACSMPELREARINIDVSFATETAQERFGSQVAANVHQEIGTVRPFKQAFIGGTVDLRAVLIEQCRGVRQAELVGDLFEVSSVAGLSDWRYGRRRIDRAHATN